MTMPPLLGSPAGGAVAPRASSPMSGLDSSRGLERRPSSPDVASSPMSLGPSSGSRASRPSQRPSVLAESAANQHIWAEDLNATCETVIGAKKVKMGKGHVFAHLSAVHEFQVSFHMTLNKVPERDCNVLHFAIGGKEHDSHLPSISVVGGSTQLVARLRQDNFHMELMSDEAGVKLGHHAQIKFQVNNGVASFQVGRDLVQADCQLPAPPANAKPLYAFLSSHHEEPAPCTVSHCMFYSKSGAPGKTEAKDKINFQVPAAEKHLIERAHEDGERNKRWAKFDSFFGTFLLANSVLIGVEVELQETYFVLDSTFIVIFIVEFLARVVIVSNSDGMRANLHDYWFYFDFIVIAVSIFESWIMTGDGMSFVSALRLIRLLKLAKMVRLIRAFKELGLLIEGLVSSLQTLFWTFLLLFFLVYVFAICLVRLAKWDNEDGVLKGPLANWSSLTTSMWRLTQMATFDNWGRHVREMAFEVGGFQGWTMAFSMLLCISLGGLGVLNMVIGILCNTSFQLDAKQKRMKGAEMLYAQKEALVEFCRLLKNYGARPLFKSDRFIGSDELFEAITNDDAVIDVIRVLELSESDFVALCQAFGENGEIEIDGLIEAIGIIELQRLFGRIKTDLLEAKVKSSMRPVDALFFNFSLREVEKSLRRAESDIRRTCSYSYDTLICLYNRSKQAHTLLRMDRHAPWVPPAQAMAPQRRTLNVQALEKITNRFNLTVESVRMHGPIDLSFGSIILLNGIFQGYQIVNTNDDRTLAVVLNIIDILFTVIFTVEFYIRVALFANLRQIHESEQTNSTITALELAELKVNKFKMLQSQMRFKIVPPLPPGGCNDIWQTLPAVLRDPAMVFDFSLIVFSLLDSVVMHYLREARVIDWSPSMLSVLRVFRLFRLAKLLRIFKVFPQLQLLISASVAVWQTIFWCLLLIMITLFAYSVYHVVLIGSYATEKSRLHYYFGNMSRAFMTGWQLISFDGWYSIVAELVSHAPGHFLVSVLLLVVVGFGVMRMCVGIMCESAITLVNSREDEQVHADLVSFVKAMSDLRDLTKHRLATTNLPQEILERALNIKMRPKVGTTDQEDGAPWDGFELTPEIVQAGKHQTFIQSVKNIFDHAKLSHENVKKVFEKMDVQKKGYISVDSLAKGAIMTKEKLTRIEMHASVQALTVVRQTCAEVGHEIATCHRRLERLLDQVCRLIMKRSHEPLDPDLKTGGSLKDVTLHVLKTEVEEALNDVGRYRGDGSLLPDVHAIGNVKVLHATGTVKVAGDMLRGVATSFSEELQQGDIIVLDIDGKHTMAVVVTKVLDELRAKISKERDFGAADAAEHFWPFKIARRVPEKQVTVVGFTAASKVANGQYQAQGVHEGVVYCEKAVEGGMFIYCLGGKRWCIGPKLGEDYAWAEMNQRGKAPPSGLWDLNGLVATGDPWLKLGPNVDVGLALGHECKIAVAAQAPLVSSSPRSAQRIFEWEVRTKRRELEKVKKVQRQRKSIEAKFDQLVVDLRALCDLELLSEVLHLYRDATDVAIAERRQRDSQEDAAESSGDGNSTRQNSRAPHTPPN